MDKLLTALDESVFTPELVNKIQELYESKVKEVQADLESKLEEATSTLEAKEAELQKVTEKAEAYAEYVKEEQAKKIEEYVDYVKAEQKAKAEAYGEYVKEELTTTLDAYMAQVVEEYKEENKLAMEESAKSAKVSAILEGFDSILVTSGVALSQIVEAKNEKVEVVAESEVAELKASMDKLLKENAKLKANVSSLEKDSVVSSLTSKMDIIQRDKFEKLAEMVVYTDKETYSEKLQTIAETVVASKKEEVKPLVETVAVVKATSRFF